MEKIAIVVPRFGEGVVGGSERLAGNLAHLLEKNYKVDILTTCAKEYITWQDYFPAGKQQLTDNIAVYRYKSDIRFENHTGSGQWERYGLGHPGTDHLQLEFKNERLDPIRNSPAYASETFLKESGPYSPGLLSHLSMNHGGYKKVIFTPYLFATTYFGLDRIPNHKALLLTAAHHEPPLYFPAFRKYHLYRWLVYFEREAQMFSKALGVNHDNFRCVKPSVGSITTKHKGHRGDRRINLAVMGRASGGKLFNIAAELTDKFRIKHPGLDCRLHIIGDVAEDMIPITNKWKDWIVVHGVVSDEKQMELLIQMDALINPSVLDSFGLVNLEAARVGLPVFMNEDCPAFVELNKTSNNAFMMFNTRNQDAKFENQIIKLLEGDFWNRKSAEIRGWAHQTYSEDAALKSFLTVLAE